MNETISYLNTDLDLTSADDLTGLAAAFDAQRVFPLHVTRAEDGRWHATFETHDSHEQPEADIAVIMAAVESLSERMRAVWSRSTRRELNIGYDCGSKPWAFNQGLSCAMLARMAAAGVSLRITLYPPS